MHNGVKIQSGAVKTVRNLQIAAIKTVNCVAFCNENNHVFVVAFDDAVDGCGRVGGDGKMWVVQAAVGGWRLVNGDRPQAPGNIKVGRVVSVGQMV